MATNFKLVSEFQTIHRRSFVINPSTILDPNNARPLIDGEWLQLRANKYEMERGGDNVQTTAGTPDGEAGADVPSYAYFAEQGRYETQAIAKGPVLYMGVYEADTKVMDGDSLVEGSPLAVFDITLAGSSVVRRGLALRSSGYIVGRVTRRPADNGGFCRFICGVN